MSKETESAEQVANVGAETDWLKDWGVLESKADPDDPDAVEAEQNSIRWYVRGYLEEYNDGVEAEEAEEPEKRHKKYKFERFEKFEFRPAGRSRFRVSVDLHPPAASDEHHNGGSAPRGGRRRGPLGGSHLVPPPPPKPGIS